MKTKLNVKPIGKEELEQIEWVRFSRLDYGRISKKAGLGYWNGQLVKVVNNIAKPIDLLESVKLLQKLDSMESEQTPSAMLKWLEDVKIILARNWTSMQRAA